MKIKATMSLDDFLHAEQVIGSMEVHAIQAYLMELGHTPLTEGQAMVLLRFHLKNTLRAAATILSAPAAGISIADEIRDSDEESLEDWLREQGDSVKGKDLPKHATHGAS